MATHTTVPVEVKDVTEGWSKWDIALYVGAPIALGVAGLWFYSRSKRGSGKKGDLGAGDNETIKGEKVSGKLAPKSQSKAPSQPQSRQELAQAAKNRGNKFFKDGKYDAAIECYTEAIKTCPPDIKNDMSTFYQNRAAAYENQKKYDQVVKDCTSALELNPKYSKALARRSKAFEVLKKYRESLEDITKACLIEGFQNQAYLMAADRVLKTLGKVKAEEKYKVFLQV
ncbi:mitochondrial import receptor subunit tom70-like [Plakobranchus ocellatus]|uniref:Mitochondrial import receptor subunit tom70-like n=1 Tax=Plakobranchus ocellatus TaxID=259542 RepID=A0AAV3ZZL9_9GAST|nr:mitochondrial import receptor subunit tom70-like [Plakobranchus ocellatus]